MSMGLGKSYLVRLVKHHYGDLESCIKFMQDNPLDNEFRWYELKPVVSVVRGQPVSCTEYMCDLLEDGQWRKL